MLCSVAFRPVSSGPAFLCGYAAPVWLEPDSLLVTRYRPQAAKDQQGPGWVARGGGGVTQGLLAPAEEPLLRLTGGFTLQECDQVHIDDVSSDDNGQDLR